MKNKDRRYAFLERIMILTIIALLIVFVVFLIASGNGVIWLKITTAILSTFTSLLCLLYLYLSGELLRQRSLWMSAAFAAFFICIVFSIILNFPCPKP